MFGGRHDLWRWHLLQLMAGANVSMPSNYSNKHGGRRLYREEKALSIFMLCCARWVPAGQGNLLSFYFTSLPFHHFSRLACCILALQRHTLCALPLSTIFRQTGGR